jgi:hypothetical protein
MKEKLGMNLLQYWTAPKNLQTSVTLFGSGQFTITSILEGPIFNYCVSHKWIWDPGIIYR